MLNDFQTHVTDYCGYPDFDKFLNGDEDLVNEIMIEFIYENGLSLVDDLPTLESEIVSKMIQDN